MRFGNDFFGVSLPAGKSPGEGGGDVQLVKVDPAGGQTVLQRLDNNSFVDAMANADGSAYAWLQRGTEAACSGPTPEGTTDLYVAPAGGSARKVTSLGDLGQDKPWQFYAWAASTLVLAEGSNRCGAGLTIDHRAKDFVNLVTGVVTPAANLTGGDCILQSVSWTGATACSSSPVYPAAPDARSIVVSVVRGEASRFDVPLSAFNIAICRITEWGRLKISPDGSETLVSTNDTGCSNGGVISGSGDRFFVVDSGTGSVQALPATDAAAASQEGNWTGAHKLTINSYDGPTETLYSVSGDGTSTTKLVSFPWN